jgi:hypothetical protein
VRLGEAADGAEDFLHGRRLAEDLRHQPLSSDAPLWCIDSSIARRISSTAWSTSKGLGRYSKAPPWKAATALSRSE